jgi:prepilin-type N-terminal cleavage/methylation domain-containing protein
MNAPATNAQRSDARQSRQSRQSRQYRAFTLLELLVVMVIIATLTAMVLAGLSSATESAKVSKTKSTIAKIHGQLVQRWAEYETRRVPILASPGESPQAFEARRLVALWELERVEMPDDYGDLFGNPSYANNSLKNAYLAAALAATAQRDLQYSSAECLYMTVMLGMNDNDEVRFLESEIGDKDQDGMPEFLDGWGRPIEFIRWAPGYVPRLGADTDVQRDDRPADAPPLGFQADGFDRRGLCRPGSSGPASTQLTSGAPATLRPPPGNTTDYYGFKLMPLVYSLGPDGEAGLAAPIDPNRAWHPYAYYTEGSPTYIGASMPDKPRGTPIVGLEGGGHADNITNHRLGTR